MSICRGNRGGVFAVFDVGQAKQSIAAISGHEYEALFALALTNGMRPSEYLALAWTETTKVILRSKLRKVE
jgi:hypothetical protein